MVRRHDGRAEHPQMMLKTFRGHLQADAYAGYDELCRPGGVIEVGCWEHARRKIWDIHQAKAPAVTAELLERIGGLYVVEEDVRGQPPDIRSSTRQSRSKPQLEELKRRMEVLRMQLSSKRALAVAVTYALNRWQALTCYLDDERLEIDNLVAERALRGVAIGRRNWFFAGSKTGGQRAAAVYLIIETASSTALSLSPISPT
jgi:transposase